MELEKLDNLNLGKENFSQEDVEDILGGVVEYDNYGMDNWDFPDPRCPKAPTPYNKFYLE